MFIFFQTDTLLISSVNCCSAFVRSSVKDIDPGHLNRTAAAAATLKAIVSFCCCCYCDIFPLFCPIIRLSLSSQ